MVACVVGGGIVGTLTAHALQRAGLEVRVLDSEDSGAATPVSAGILFCIRDWQQGGVWESLARAGRAAYPGLCAQIESKVGYECRGLLSVSADAANLIRWAQNEGLTHHVLSPQEFRQRYSQLTPPSQDAVLLPDIAQINPAAFVQYWRGHLQEQGVCWERAHVRHVLTESTAAFGVSDGSREWTAEHVVLAAGAWSSTIHPPIPEDAIIEPRRGQILVWRDMDTAELPVVLEGERYLVARSDGTILVGATNEAAGFDAQVTEDAREQLAEFARRWYPDLPNEPAEHWAGLRPRGVAHRPSFGAHPEIRGLYFNTGHYRHGIVCAPETARHVAEQIKFASGMGNPI